MFSEYVLIITLLVGNPVELTTTAYTSEIRQTDNQPCIAASNYPICEAYEEDPYLIACPREYALGTLFLREKTGEIYTCRDRLSKKNDQQIDIYMGYDTKNAVEYGRQTEIWKPIHYTIKLQK